MSSSIGDDDRGFLYGDGLFETVRVEEGNARFVERHCRRIEHSASELGYPEEAVEEALQTLMTLTGSDDGLWRVTMTRPGSEMFGGGSGTVTTRRRSLPEPMEDGEGLELTIVEGLYFPNDWLAQHKTTSWIRSVEAHRRAQQRGFDEALMTSVNGRVGEASSANIFARVGGSWVTPPVQGILPGIIREVVLERAKENGIEIEERPLLVGDLQTCAALALTSSGRLVTPVKRLGNQHLDVAPVRELQDLVG